jgi:hypothetical protein
VFPRACCARAACLATVLLAQPRESGD